MPRREHPKIPWPILIFVLLLSAIAVHADSLLIANGKALATILLPAQAETDETKAARILQTVFCQMTGVTLPIASEPAEVSGHIISVGRTRLVPEALGKRLMLGKKLIFADARRDAFVVASREGDEANTSRLFLLGHRARGTLFSAYDVLETLGCRWFFAYEAGACIPRRPRLAVKTGDTFKQPHFAFRFVYTWGGPRTKETRAKEEAWFEANKMSGVRPKEGSSAHNFSRIWPETLYEEHPEFFPLNRVEQEAVVPIPEVREDLLTQEEGDAENLEPGLDEPSDKSGEPDQVWKRVPYGQRCLSNPQVIRIGVDWARDIMAEHPDYDMVPFIQNDGMKGFCQCAPCTALGHYGDQNIYLANQVGKEFFKTHPDKMIHILSYFESARVPHRKVDGYDTDSDRVWVTIFSNFAKVPFDDLVRGWAKASHHLEVGDAWQFFSGELTRRPGWPRSYSSRLKRYRFYRENNVVALKTIIKSEWARHGLARYLSARLMWDVDADIDALIDDFCQKMFPGAATEFRQFISLYDAIESGDIDMSSFLRQGFLRLGHVRTKLKTDEERKRWEFYALYLHDLVLEERLSRAKTAYDKLALNRQIVRFLRAIEDRGILESSQRIGMIYLPRLKHLKWAKFSGPNAPTLAEPDTTDGLASGEEEALAELALDEPDTGATSKDAHLGQGLTWHGERMAILESIPVLELDADTIDRFFDEDRNAYPERQGDHQ